jgi:predicted transcriptional regulator
MTDEQLETIAAVKEGLKDVAAGRTRPAREVLAELAKKHNLPLPEPKEAMTGD